MSRPERVRCFIIGKTREDDKNAQSPPRGQMSAACAIDGSHLLRNGLKTAPQMDVARPEYPGKADACQNGRQAGEDSMGGSVFHEPAEAMCAKKPFFSSHKKRQAAHRRPPSNFSRSRQTPGPGACIATSATASSWWKRNCRLADGRCTYRWQPSLRCCLYHPM